MEEVRKFDYKKTCIMREYWKVDREDESEEKPSWKYIGYTLRRNKNGEVILRWKLNPHFAFSHLDPHKGN